MKLVTCVALAVTLLSARSGHAVGTSTAVAVEAVEGYSHQPGFSDIICIAEADGYRDGLLDAGGFITAGQRFTNDNVWDTDFTDPDVTGNDADNDTRYFDHVGKFSSYFCGHGMCDDDRGNTSPCTKSSQCTHPPAGQTGPGFCVGNGPLLPLIGTCFYAVDKTMVINRSLQSPAHSPYGGKLRYSDGKTIKWGESAKSGGWAGAGTNGGVNFAIISNSCGLRPWLQVEEVGKLFAGVQLLGIIMPITPGSDDVDAPDRGDYIAEGYATNVNSSVGQSFLDAINSMDEGEGSSCPTAMPNQDYTFGGGHGIAGCGAHAIVSFDSTAKKTTYHTTEESWAAMTDDAHDAQGDGWDAIYIACNYDCNTYPITL